MRNIAIISVAFIFSAMVSLLWWRSDLLLCACVYCVDGYCEYGDKLLKVLTHWDVATLRELHTFTQSYVHAHNPLAPFFMAMFSFLIPQRAMAFMVMSGLATLISWIYIRKSVGTTWPLPPPLRLMIFSGFCTHIIVIQAFVRPITDALGMMCTIIALFALTRHIESRTFRTSALLLAAQFLGLFSRVSFLPMLGMPAVAELLSGESYSKRVQKATMSGIVYGLLPGLLYLGVNYFLGTLALTKAWENAHLSEFTNDYNLRSFLTSSITALQGYGIIAVMVSPHILRNDPTFRIHFAWVMLYLAFLALGGGASWPRYFLPLVPSVFVLAVPTLKTLHESDPGKVRVLLALFIMGNFLYATAHIDWGGAGRLLVDEVQATVRPEKASKFGAIAPRSRAVNDFDGDGHTDLAVYDTATSNWFFVRSKLGFGEHLSFGGPGFIPVPGDYDGNGKADTAIYEAGTGKWVITQPSPGFHVVESFGGWGFIPVPGDYNGDGKTDAAIYDKTTGKWFLGKSTSGFAVHPGGSGYGFIPVPDDYDGDGKTDAAVYNKTRGDWYINQSTAGHRTLGRFGGPGFLAVPGDYDGDGKTDLAVYEKATGNWFIKRSKLGFHSHYKFGGPGFIPVPGDYDGDGKTDLAVYEKATGNWFIDRSKLGFHSHYKFGGPGFIPVSPSLASLQDIELP